MSKNTEEDEFKPTVQFELKPKYQAFLKYLFERDKNGVILLNKSNEISKVISSAWNTSNRPVIVEMKNPCTVQLPITSSSHHVVKYNNIFIPRWRQEQIRIFIESCFDIYIRECFVIGYEHKWGRDKIVENLLKELNREEYFFTFDQLIKFDYRNRVNISEKLRFEFKNTANKLKINN